MICMAYKLFVDKHGVEQIYAEAKCDKCQQLGFLHMSIHPFEGKHKNGIEVVERPTRQVYNVASGMYVGLHVCDDCSVDVYNKVYDSRLPY